MKITRLAPILLIIATLLTPVGVHAAETATQILSKCAAKVNNAPSLTLKFRLEYNGEHSDCTMTLAKQKYRLSASKMEVWYDGITQWTYTTENKELSITEPTPDELLECNPFAILNGFNKIYNCRRLKGQGYQIELTPKVKGSTVKKAVVSIDAKTYIPSKLIVTMSNGHTFSAIVKSSDIGKTVPASTFIYNKAKYPAKTTIDLR